MDSGSILPRFTVSLSHGGRLIKKIDLDGNGDIDTDEFCKYFNKQW
jgi:Ca2+-binding EF-hand superfamily protein